MARHTLLVLAMVVRDQLYLELDQEEKNILKWACLLHDIAKLSSPTIEGKDHVHPFKSGIIVLDLFERMGLIENISEASKIKLS